MWSLKHKDGLFLFESIFEHVEEFIYRHIWQVEYDLFSFAEN